MIHPTQARDLHRLTCTGDDAAALQAGEAVVIGGISHFGPFLIQPSIALEHGGTRLAQRQVKPDRTGCAIGVGLQPHHLWRHFLRRPVLQPDAEAALALGAGQPPGAAAVALKAVVFPALPIGQGEMSHVDLVGRQGRYARRQLRGQRRAKEGQLIPVFVAGIILQIARVVPPFGAILRVRSVVAWKDELDWLDGASIRF